MPIAIVSRRSHNSASRRPQAVLVKDQLATAVSSLSQREKAARRTPELTLAERNYLRARRYLFEGQLLIVREIAELTGLAESTISLRIKRNEPIRSVHPRGVAPKLHQFRGEELTATQIADRTGLSESAVRSRLLGGKFIAYGDMDDLPRDARINARFLEFKGRTQTISKWAHEYGLDATLVFGRLSRGWSVHRSLTTKADAHMLAFNGRRQSVSAWARQYGLPINCVHKRLRLGWTVKAALTTPLILGKTVEFNGRTQTASAWAREFGLYPHVVNTRLKRGWTVERALTTHGRTYSRHHFGTPSPALKPKRPGPTRSVFIVLRGPAQHPTRPIPNQTQQAPP